MHGVCRLLEVDPGTTLKCAPAASAYAPKNASRSFRRRPGANCADGMCCAHVRASGQDDAEIPARCWQGRFLRIAARNEKVRGMFACEKLGCHDVIRLRAGGLAVFKKRADKPRPVAPSRWLRAEAARR